MDEDTVFKIQELHKESMKWCDEPIFPHGDVEVNLSGAVGPDAKTPPNVPDPPKHYPLNCVYRFDTSKYCGKDSIGNLVKDFGNCCQGTSWYMQKEAIPPRQAHVKTLSWTLYCNHYLVRTTKEDTSKSDRLYTRDGLTSVFYKATNRHVNAFGRLKNAKLRSRRKKKEAHDIAVKLKEKSLATNRRTGGAKAEHKSLRCHAHVVITMVVKTGYFFLNTSSVFEHENHRRPLLLDSVRLGKASLDDDNKSLVKMLYQGGVPLRTIIISPRL